MGVSAAVYGGEEKSGKSGALRRQLVHVSASIDIVFQIPFGLDSIVGLEE